MKKIYCIALLFVFSSTVVFAQNLFTSKNISVSFFSEATLENIEAFSKNGVALLNPSKNDLVFNVQIKSFVFDKSLMQEHFNENYMESDKYPLASFKGVLDGPIDYKKDGEYKVKAIGKLTIHGKTQNRTLDGIVSIKNGIISLYSEFPVACKDHDVKIPSLMTEKIGDVLKVTVSGNFEPRI